MTVRGLTTSPVAGRSKPSAASPALSAAASPIPATRPAADATTPMTSDSPRTEADHLSAARADGAQQRQFAQPLGDDDRERVEDQERPDEQRDEREDSRNVSKKLERLADASWPSAVTAWPLTTSTLGLWMADCGFA